MTLTYQDEQKVRQIVRNEVKEEVKDQLTDFRSEMKSDLDKILHEVVSTREELIMIEGHKDQIEELTAGQKDHEDRLQAVESQLSLAA